MLNVGIMLGMIGDHCYLVWSASYSAVIDLSSKQTNDGGYRGSRGSPSQFSFYQKTFLFFIWTHVAPPATTETTDPARDSHANDSVPPPDPCHLCMTRVMHYDF